MTYEIRTVADFLKVPPDKLLACFADFASWLELCEAMVAAEVPGLEVLSGCFIWIDDGRNGVHISIEVK